MDGADLRFHSFRPDDTSLHCQSTDMGYIVHRAVCLFTPQLSLHL